RIREPRDPGATRRGPRTALVLLQAVVAPRLDTARAQRRDGRLEIVDAPAEDGVGRAGDRVDARHPQLRAVRIEDLRERRRVDELEPEDAAVERLGRVEVRARREGD